MRTTFDEPEEHTCYCCGHKGTDCHSETMYIGGQGYAQRWYCDDVDACNKRWDKLYVKEVKEQ